MFTEVDSLVMYLNRAKNRGTKKNAEELYNGWKKEVQYNPNKIYIDELVLKFDEIQVDYYENHQNEIDLYYHLFNMIRIINKDRIESKDEFMLLKNELDRIFNEEGEIEDLEYPDWEAQCDKLKLEFLERFRNGEEFLNFKDEFRILL